MRSPSKVDNMLCRPLQLPQTINVENYHMPSFSRMWSEPVPKLSSPQMDNFPASIRFPKNFQPVGTWMTGSIVCQERSISKYKPHFPSNTTVQRELHLKERKVQFFSYTIQSTTCWHRSSQTLQNSEYESFLLSSTIKIFNKKKKKKTGNKRWKDHFYLRATLEIWNGFLCIGSNNCNRVGRSNKKAST